MLEPGATLPPFSLPDQTGEEQTLADITGPKGVILYVYPKDNTPGCTLESKDFSDQRAAFETLGYRVVGMSKDSVASHCRFIDEQGLEQSLLSDPETALIEPLGAWGEKKLYGKVRLGIIRSTFVVAAGGELLIALRNVRAKGHVARVLDKLRAL